MTVIILLLCVGMSQGSNDSAFGNDGYRPPDCSGRSLFILLRLYNKKVDLAEIERSLPEGDATRGHTMADLQDASASCGLPLRGLHLSPAEFKCSKPIIAHMVNDGVGHFVVLRPVGQAGTMVQMIEPPFAPVVMDYNELLKGRNWTGNVLVPTDPVNTFLSASLLVAFAISIAMLFWRVVTRNRIVRAGSSLPALQ